jgi:hypothetical protein
METETLDLTCTATFYKGNSARVDLEESNLWKTCIWTRNIDDSACTQTAIDALSVEKGQCDTSMKNAGFEKGNRKKCKLSIPDVTLKYRGNWTCRIEKCSDETGGCSTKRASDCYGEATVYVVVLYSYVSIMTWEDNFYYCITRSYLRIV